VTATFIKEAGIQVERPDTVTADTQDDASILIAISSTDEIWIDRQKRDPRAVRGIISRMHSENPKGSIVIQADEESTHETLVIVMEAAKGAGVTNVAIASDDG
jgi:biopolymer transport protein ExbD